MPSTGRHPRDDELFTPMTPEVLNLLRRMRDEHGSWREVAAISGTRTRVLRRLYRLERKSVSHRLLDRLCVTTEVGHVDEFPWFTADDLVALGIWEPVEYFEGLEADLKVQKVSKARAERRRKRRKRIRKLRRERPWDFE